MNAWTILWDSSEIGSSGGPSPVEWSAGSTIVRPHPPLSRPVCVELPEPQAYALRT